MAKNKDNEVDVDRCPCCGRTWNQKISILELAEAVGHGVEILEEKLRTDFGQASWRS